MCFTQPDKCIEYTGPSAKDLGIEQGMKQSELNAQIVSLLSQFKVALDKCKCSSSASIGKDADITLSNDTYKQYTLSNCINQINTKSFNYSVIKGDTIRFSYLRFLLLLTLKLDWDLFVVILLPLNLYILHLRI